MQLNRIRVCMQADQALRHLKARTGLTPNLLCRLGYCLSLQDPIIPNKNDYPEISQREFNRYTLTGQWDDFFLALLKQRLSNDEIPLIEMESQFVTHINRGVILLFQRVKNIHDISRLAGERNSHK